MDFHFFSLYLYQIESEKNGSNNRVVCTDVSRLIRPEAVFSTNKPVDAFRNYENVGGIHDRVRNTYKLMHTHQTMEFSQRKVNCSLLRILI